MSVWNVSRSGQFISKEVLKYSLGNEIKGHAVLDANAFPMPADRDARNFVPAGTILKLSATDPKKYVQYDGAGTIKGILVQNHEFQVSATAGVRPAAFYFHNAVFATSAIVGFTLYASALVSTLNTCKFE